MTNNPQTPPNSPNTTPANNDLSTTGTGPLGRMRRLIGNMNNTTPPNTMNTTMNTVANNSPTHLAPIEKDQTAIPAEVQPEESELQIQLRDQINAQFTSLVEWVVALDRSLTRYSKEQIKANALTEASMNEIRRVLDRLGAIERQSQLRMPGTGALGTFTNAAATNTISSANNTSQVTRLLEAMMPILDSIEAALQSGKLQIEALTDNTAREILAGWLEGQRLQRERLLVLLDKEGVTPIATIGQPFDPYRHVAVGRAYDPSRPHGVILEERRRGYETTQRVLRFADVIVNSTINTDTLNPNMLNRENSVDDTVNDTFDNTIDSEF